MKSIIRLFSLILVITLFAAPLASCSFAVVEPGGSEGAGNKELPPLGNEIGKRCIPTDLELVSGEGTVNIQDYKGKVVILNFWGTWCGPCKGELPHFDEVAEEYAEDVVIITVHSYQGIENAPQYITENFHNSKMIFANDNETNKYYKALNPGLGSWPVTIVIDADGVITNKIVGAIEKNTLIDEINKAK
ncbi:MAG: TlpA family protein disulfide reductase [Clostridia bacterium]|nr:TlpA family protein disulfide reductase [Clostridia bacterium]